MKHQYTGDIGDFSKFALLRGLPDRKIGLAWYLTCDEPHGGRSDGSIRNLPRLVADAPDQALIEAFAPFHAGAPEGGIAAFEPLMNGILGHDEMLCWCRGVSGRHNERRDRIPIAERHERRDAWIENALAAVDGSDVVLLDPDNGLAPRSIRHGALARANKYVLPDELRAFADGGAVILYQHATRQPFHRLMEEKQRDAGLGDAFALRWRIGQNRSYIFYNAEPLRQWAMDFAAAWQGAFEYWPSPSGAAA